MVGEDLIRFQIGMRVFMKTARAVPARIGVDAMNGKVHLGEPPGGVVDLLPIDRQIERIAAVIFDKFLGLNEHAARSAARVINPALIRFQHVNQGEGDGPKRFLPGV